MFTPCSSDCRRVFLVFEESQNRLLYLIVSLLQSIHEIEYRRSRRRDSEYLTGKRVIANWLPVAFLFDNAFAVNCVEWEQHDLRVKISHA